MRVCHSLDPVFDDPNLIAYGGLPAVMALAEQAGLYDLVDAHVTVPGTASANASVKVPAIIAGLIAGADSISDLDVLRHGGMGRIFTGLRAPTTLGTHLRACRFGHVRQLDAVAARLLVNLAPDHRAHGARQRGTPSGNAGQTGSPSTPTPRNHPRVTPETPKPSFTKARRRIEAEWGMMSNGGDRLRREIGALHGGPVHQLRR